MNTKLIMTASALFLAVLGISLTFLPREIAGVTGISSAKTFQLMLQIMGALYFSFAMINWMAKGAIIGGIYNKPLAIGNFTHLFIDRFIRGFCFAVWANRLSRPERAKNNRILNSYQGVWPVILPLQYQALEGSWRIMLSKSL